MNALSFPKEIVNRKVAIVHDALVVPAGSERVALQLSDIFPGAPIFTSAYLPENTFPEFKKKNIFTLPFSKFVKNERQFKSLYPIWYMGVSSLDLSDFDLIISNSNYLAKFINPQKSTTHICYLHNPIRFLWKTAGYSSKSLPFGKLSKFGINLFLPFLQKLDISRTQKLNHVLTNSQNMHDQVKSIYDVNSTVLYPPVDVSSFKMSESPGDYYLYAGRLISHKRADLAIQACNQLHRQLIIAGDGLERKYLESIAGDTVKFLGNVTDQQLKNLYANCKALIFPSDEDFGLVPVESQAAGRPVIAYGKGGALETVVDYETGLFFENQTADSLINAIIKFENIKFDPLIIRQNAIRFDLVDFKNKLMNYICSRL